MSVNITVLIPAKNEEKNLRFCLEPLVGWARKIIVVDSNSQDRTVEMAISYGAEIIQFIYKGGWPKKRQYVLDTYNFQTDWILLLDCDEILTDTSKKEIENALQDTSKNGYYLFFREEFLGRMLKYAVPGLRKLSLFRTGKGKYEMRIAGQDSSMGDMEVHEHVVVQGATSNLEAPVLHRNYNSMHRYIEKHNQYSNYDAVVQVQGTDAELKSGLFGSVEQRRRWIKKKLIRNPLAPVCYFFYMYIFRLGFLDGIAGFYYILYQALYLYFVSSKMYEMEHLKKPD